MIHKIRIRGYKSIRDVTVELSPVTVLVGKSGTGKSNFVNAIRALRDVLIVPNTFHSFVRSKPGNESELDASVDVTFSVPGFEPKFRYALVLTTFGGSFSVDEQLHLGETCLFHQAPTSEQSQRPRWAVPPPAVKPLEPGRIVLGRIPSIHEVVVAFTALTTGIGCYAFSDQVLLSPNPGQPAGPSSQSFPGLSDGAGNFLETLRSITVDLENPVTRKTLRSALHRLNSTLSTVELDQIQNPTSVVVGHLVDGKSLELGLNDESAGFRRFLAHLLALYQRPSKQVMIFEHPEDGIHPGALSLLADEFKGAPERNHGQIILTTHSPEFLNNFDAEQIRVVEKQGFETRIGPLAPEQKEAIQESLLGAGELLTVDPARAQLVETAGG